MKTHEVFTEEEQELLAPYVTNTDQSIFALTNLPEVIKGALFSRYSRSTLGLRKLLLKDFIQNQEAAFDAIQGASPHSSDQVIASRLAIEKAQDFYDRILDGYGDDSIGELGGAHLALENVSILATKVIQDARIGGSPLEKSTRYVSFNKKVNGEYLFYQDPTLLESKYAELYLQTNRMLFDTYTELIDPLTEFVQKNLQQESGISDAAYRRSVKAKVFDLIRGILPASTLTNMGVFGNGRFFENLIGKMHIHPTKELQQIAEVSYQELSKLIPSFIRRAEKEHRHFKTFATYSQKLTRTLANHAEQAQNMEVHASDLVTLVDYTDNAEQLLLASMLYPHLSQPFAQIMQYVNQLSTKEKNQILHSIIDLRENRRQKSGRGLETVFYTFDILGDYGMYRDLQRHRMLTQERQLLSTRHGYVIPEELVLAGVKEKYDLAMKKAAEAFETIAQEYPLQAQYVVPLAYNIRWFVHINLRALVWLVELRSTPQGHESYRKVAQEMYQKIEEVHPMIAKLIKFVDLEEYGLGRLDAEIRLEQRKTK